MPKTRPSRTLFYLKIVKAERKAEGENEVFGLGFAEAHPILGEAKDTEILRYSFGGKYSIRVNCCRNSSERGRWKPSMCREKYVIRMCQRFR